MPRMVMNRWGYSVALICLAHLFFNLWRGIHGTDPFSGAR
jgi:hypothetical protein